VKSLIQLAARDVALAVLAVALAYSGRASAAPREPVTCSLDESVTHELPPGAHIELLLAAGITAPIDRRRTYEEMARAVLACVGDGTHVEILPVTDSGIGIAPVFAGSMPGGAHVVPRQAERMKAEFSEKAGAAIHSVLITTRPYQHSDLLGTLYAAGEVLHRSSAHAKLVVIIISNGWHQTQQIDMFRYGVNPGAYAEKVLATLRKERSLPNLSAAAVIMSGFAPGARRIQMKQSDMIGLCDFWRKIVRASGGSMPLPCEQVLPGLTIHI
jgi:hypothetical protein